MSKKETYRATEYSFSECCMRLIRSLVAFELLYYGVCQMLCSSFEHWVLSKEARGWMQLLLVGTIVVNECLPLLGRRYMVKLRVLFEALMLGWIGWRTWQIRETLWTSFRAWFDDYLPYWNQYYGTNFYAYNEGGELGYAFAFTLLLLLLCVVILRYVSEWRIFMILPNLAAAGAALLVNVRPDARSLLVSFVGVLVLYSGGWEAGRVQVRARLGRQRRTGRRMLLQTVAIAATVLAAGVVVGVTMGCFTSSANRIPNYAPKVLAFQQKAEAWVMSLGPGKSGSQDINQATLDNTKPEYSGNTVLTIHSDQIPQTNLYLKSFCSFDYEDGTWQPLDDSYAKEAQDRLMNDAVVAKKLQQMTYDKMKQDSLDGILDAQVAPGKLDARMRINYENPDSESAFLPYLWDPSSSDADLWLEKDGVWRKGNEASVEFTQCTLEPDNLFSRTEMNVDTGDKNYETYEYWYRNYVMEHNGGSDEDLPMVQEYANKVSSAMQGNSLLSDDADQTLCNRVKEKLQNQIIFYGPDEYEDCFANNLARNAVALEVRNQLFSNTSYNLYLDKLPAGEDPVAYFLGTSKEGYCMHYASAATLMLQQLGVPARYASGYIVKQGSFGKDEDFSEAETKEKPKPYKTIVNDYNAHAWVEIYMDGIGWMPYEMTPGYTSKDNKLLTDGTHDADLQEKHEKHKEEQPASEQTPEPTEMQASQAPETQIPETNASTQNTPLENTNPKTSHTKALLITLLIIVLAGLLLYGIYRMMVQYRQALLQELKARRNRNAVKRINRRIYYRLMKGRPVVKRTGRFEIHTRPVTDAEFAQKLVKTYSTIPEADWKRYMEIVKKCAFSHEVITDEEAEFCYRIYKTRCK